MKKIQIGVCEFAVPVPLSGSIELQSGYGRSNQQGLEIHARVQEERAESDPHYQFEVGIAAEFEREGYLFRVSGKIDGLTEAEGKTPVIEEIKSSLNTYELSKKLKNTPDHPYCLQLLTYGYFYFLKSGKKPDLAFQLVSTRTFSSDSLNVTLDVDAYEDWLERRLAELVEETKASEKRTQRRKAMARQFSFPFESPRPNQQELMQTVSESLDSQKRLLLQAPTGLGKTAGVLHPVLKEALSRGQRVVYITPKNSQHSVAEDAVDRFKESGSRVKSLTITAKSKICMKNEALCNPDYCEYARDHYTKVSQNKIKELLFKKRKLTSRVFRKLAEEFEVCPFELQVDAAIESDVIICDYNYVFAPRNAFGQVSRSTIGQEGKPSLVIDEAHNLFSRALGYYSPELSTLSLEKMRSAIQELPSQFRLSALRLLDNCIEIIQNCRPEGEEKSQLISPPTDDFLGQELELRAFLSRYLESDIEIQPRDVVLRLCFYWSEFTDALEYVNGQHPEFFTTFRSERGGGGTIRIVCCDASKMLKAAYDQYGQVVGFSATLKPFDYYATLSGLDPAETDVAEFQSPFPKSHRKLLIIPEVSTKYSERDRHYPRIAEAIHRITQVKKGNYFAFFPSFDFLEKVLERFTPPEGFMTLRQTREMKAKDIQNVFDHLKEQSSPTVVFAVQGGVFAEGVDYPGETVIGAFVIGPPLPPFELEREKMRKYYQDHYGPGFEYAYAFPAMAKAVQAAGRVIRSETDKGLIVLMDSRFLLATYSHSMPSDWFDESPHELVSKKILQDVSAFWDSSLL